ncbi:MAG: ABC transporter ATP-binding protein [Enhydrobacter sp.]|nr:MAG: ABC transporter ATP-binding protein [Enhydrobacter sp.]
MPDTILDIRNLHAWYGQSHVLHGVDLSVDAGELVTLIGRNGAGKSTTLKSIMGLVPQRTGSIRFEGAETVGIEPHEVARLGIAYCPEDRGVYATLDVAENLQLPPKVRPGGLSMESVLDLFPNLRERLRSPGTKLSGGEQQMLAIGRILRTGAPLLLLDEPTEGLAPVVVEQIGEIIRRLKRDGLTILMVEQNVRFATTIADRHYVMERGRVVEALDNARLKSEFDRVTGLLGV